MTRAERNIAWIERNLRVPEGRFVGQRLRLREWQKHEIRKIYDNPAGTRTALLSFARKNGKTMLAAALLLLHLAGPEAVQNTQLYSCAQAREQAAIVFNLAAKMVRMSADLSAHIGIRDTAKELYCKEKGTQYRALSSEATNAYGLSPIFAIHDELGQVQGPRSPMYDAIETGMMAHDEPLSIVISTQAPTDGDLLSLLIDEAAKGKDPKTVLGLYTAPMDMDPFSEEAQRAANPGYGDIQNATEMRKKAEEARNLPSQEPVYRNYVLNQRVELRAPFISRTIWEGLGGLSRDLDFAGDEEVLGIDLSAVRDLTAIVAISKGECADSVKRWRVRPYFWLPEEGLRERAAADRVPYDTWAAQGHLTTKPGPAIDYEDAALWLFDYFQDHNVLVAGFDRWNWRHFRPWLSKAGFKDKDLEGKDAKFMAVGMGTATMSPALRTLESWILTKDMQHDDNPVMNMCMANAVVTSIDPANRTLDKKKSRTRIDGAMGLAIAAAAAGEHLAKKPNKAGIRLI